MPEMYNLKDIIPKNIKWNTTYAIRFKILGSVRYVLQYRIWNTYTVVNFYSKTNQMHNISNLFYFGTTLYMFPTVSPSIIRSLRLYIFLMLYVQSQTPDDGWRDCPKHVECLGFVCPCIIIYSNKSTNQMHQSLTFIACRLTL